ncbi:MAG: phosphate signaling complex protein PhoU [Caulobacter sp.]|nr:phosphate signaling complex protein PhoU [Caulobacter sp.]
MGDHTMRAYDAELERLTQAITRMGGLAESQLDQAIGALVRRDSDLAAHVVAGDHQIDDLEHEVQNLTVRLLALRQPMAIDLRAIVAALRISSDLERIGDYAANVAKRALVLNRIPMVEPVGAIPRMGRVVAEIIREVLDAYVENDADKALAAWRRDEEVDEMHTSLFRELITYMMEDPRNITACTHLMFIAKNIERIGDHATNVAETIHFQVRGTPIAGERPKADAIAPPPRAAEESP